MEQRELGQSARTIHSKTVSDIINILDAYLKEKELEELYIRSQKVFNIFKGNKNYQIDLDHFNRQFGAFESLIGEADLGLILARKHKWFSFDHIPEAENQYELNKNVLANFSGLFPSVAASFIDHYLHISHELFDTQFYIYKNFFEIRFIPSTEEINPHLIESLIYGTHKYFQILSGERLTSIKIYHNGVKKNSQLYQDSYGVLPDFTESKEYILKYTLSTPLNSFNKSYLGYLAWLEKLYARNCPNTSFANRNRAMIKALLPLGLANRENISRIYNLSVSSLQRKLKSEGSTFSDLVLEERMKLATHYLKESDIPISEVSELLGYQEIAHFSKAFKRWYGTSPSQYT